MNFSESTPRWAKVMIALCSLAIGSCYVACQHRNAQPQPSATKPAPPKPRSVVLGTKSYSGLTVVAPGDLNAPPASEKPHAVVLGTKSMGGLVPAPVPQPLPPSQENPQQQQQVQQIQR